MLSFNVDGKNDSLPITKYLASSGENSLLVEKNHSAEGASLFWWHFLYKNGFCFC